MKIIIKIISFCCIILLNQEMVIAQRFVNKNKLEMHYNNAKKQGLICFDILGKNDYSLSKHVNEFLRSHPDLGIASFGSSRIVHYGVYKPATNNLKLFFIDKMYSLYPEEYNTLAKIESLKECLIYDFSAQKYKKGRWTGRIDQEGYAEGDGIGFYDISFVSMKTSLKYGGMIKGNLENGKPNGFCDIKQTTIENNSYGQETSYDRYSGKFSNGKKDGEFIIELSNPISLRLVKNIKYILTKYSNDYGVGIAYFFNPAEEVIAEGTIDRNGQINITGFSDDDIKTIIGAVGIVVGAKVLLAGGIKALQYLYRNNRTRVKDRKHSYDSKDNEYFTILSDDGRHAIDVEKRWGDDYYASINVVNDGFFFNICKTSFYLKCYAPDRVIYETGEWSYAVKFDISSEYDFPAILEIGYKSNCSDDKYKHIRIKIKQGGFFSIFLQSE